MINKIKYIVTHKTIQNLSFVTFGNVFNAGLGFLALILVSRQVGPEQFGIFSVIFGLFTLLSKMGDFGTNQTAMRYIAHFRAKGNTIDEKKVIGFFLGATYFLIGLSGLIFFPTHKIIADFLNIGPYSSLVFLAILFSFAFVMFNTYAVIFQSYEKFKPYVLVFFLVGIFKLLSVGGFYIAGYNQLNPYLFIYFLSPLVGFLVFYYIFHLKEGFKVKPNLDKKIFFVMTPFLYYMAVSDVTGAFAEQLGVFTSSAILSSYETGLFGAAQKLSMVFALISGSLGIVLIPKASKYSDFKNIKNFAKKALVLGSFLFTIILPVAIFPKFFISITSGADYLQGSKVLTILTVSGGFKILRSSFTTVFYSLGRAEYFAVVGVLNILLQVPLMFYLGSRFGIEGIAYGKLLTSILFFILAIVYYIYILYAKDKK